jgi:hypothetical protein
MQVQVTGKEDKRGLTACVTTTLAGIVLALQLIYGGQREKNLPRKEARSEAEAASFVFSLTKNHWCMLESMQEWIEKVNILNSFVIPPQVATLTGDAVILDDTWYKHFFQNHRHS